MLGLFELLCAHTLPVHLVNSLSLGGDQNSALLIIFELMQMCWTTRDTTANKTRRGLLTF